MPKNILAVIKTKKVSIEVLGILEKSKQNVFKKTKDKVDLTAFGITLAPSKDPIVELDYYISLLKNAPIITVTSVVPLDMDFIDTLYKWFVAEGLKGFLLDLKIDTNIYGGLLIEYKGVYHDLSLRKKVNAYVHRR